MLTCCISANRIGGCALIRSLTHLLVAIALLLHIVPVALATPTDDQYFQIYSVIDQADALAKNGQVERAKVKYAQAEKDLRELKQISPGYNPKLVTARLNYVIDRIGTLSKPVSNAVTNADSGAGAVVAKRAAAAGQPNIKLVSAGAEPRAVLRLKPEVGAVQKAKVVIKMKMGIAAPNMPEQMMAMPAMNLTATITTKTVNADGEATFNVVIDDATVSKDAGVLKEVAESLEQQFAAVKGMTMAGVVEPNFYTRKIDAKIPAGASAETKESMQSMGKAFANQEFILPDEAIGVGAKWEVKQKKKDEGMTIDEVIEHELVSIDGDLLVVKSTVSSSAANQKISNPMMPGSKVDLTKLTGSSKETATYSLSKLVPVKAEADEKTETIMSLNAGGKKQAMTMKQEMSSTLETE